MCVKPLKDAECDVVARQQRGANAVSFAAFNDIPRLQ